MQLNYKVFKILSTKKASAGYTLTELLIGAAIATIVIGAAGFGLFQTTKSSQKGGAEKERQEEVARAYNFISDEIRRARLVENNSNVTTDATSFDLNKGEVVLVLKVPVDTNVDRDSSIELYPNAPIPSNNEANVIYYVSDPVDSVWKGPKVLYRWGPPLDNSGEYTDRNWVYQPLIDKLDDSTIDPNCETGWTASSAPGFAVCIDRDNKTAQLFINGKIATAGGYNETYKSADTKTVARANRDNSVAGASIPNSTKDLDGSFNCMTPKPGQTPSVITGITFYDDTNGDPINGDSVPDTSLTPTKTVSTGGSFKFDNYYKKNKITVSAISQGCDPTITPKQNVAPISVTIDIDSSGNPTLSGDTNQVNQVKMFRNGEVLSSELLKNKYPGQDTFIKFLKDRGVTINWTDTDGDGQGGVDGQEDANDQYTIVLNNDELLLAFEIGQDSATIGGVENPGFDFQDKLVLVTSDALAP